MTRRAVGSAVALGLTLALAAGCGRVQDARSHGSPAPVSVPGSAGTSTPTSPGAATSAAKSTAIPDLGAIDRALSSVDAGTAQVNKDVAAGDSARAQNDDN